MVIENRKGEQVDAEAAGQKPQPLFKPAFAVIEVPAADRIVAAEKAESSAARSD
jgi:hypothetical protein